MLDSLLLKQGWNLKCGRLPEWLKGSDLKSEEGLWSSASSNLAPSFMQTMWKTKNHSITLEELLEEIREVPVTTIPVGTLKLFGSNVLLEEERIENADLSFPIILIFKKGVLFRIVDGNHRIEKASRMGVKELPCRKVLWKNLSKKIRRIFG